MGKGLQWEHTPDKMYFLQGKMTEMVQAFQNPGFLKRETGQAKAGTAIPATGHPGIVWVGKVESTPSWVPGTTRPRKGLEVQNSLQWQDRYKGHPGAVCLRDTLYSQDISFLPSF